MIIYYILLILLPFLGYITAKLFPSKLQNIIFLSSSAVILTFVSSIRYGIGADYFSYRKIYEQMSQVNIYQLLVSSPVEPLYSLLQKIVFLLGGNYILFLTVISLFIHAVIMWFIYRFSKLPWLSVYLYISLQFFAHSMNLLRQSISVCFFMLAYPHLKNRKFLPYCTLLLIGSLFHKSALLMIPFYFILSIRDSKKFVTITFFIFILFYCFSDKAILLLTTYIFPEYASYLDSIFWRGNSFLYAIFPILYLLFIQWTKNCIVSQTTRTLYYHSAFFTCLNWVLITKHFILERTTIYFFILSLIILPDIAISIAQTDLSSQHTPLAKIPVIGLVKKHKYLLCILVASLCYFLFAASRGYHNVYPYYSLLDRAGN